MGPLLLLSLLGIGAATALVDVGPDEATDDSQGDGPGGDREETLTEEVSTDLLDGFDPAPATGSVEVLTETEDQTSPSNLHGTESDDILHARGEENIDGGAGDDTLRSFGEGMILGGEGDDVFTLGGEAEGFGGQGEDYMYISDAASGFGGDGDDTFFLKPSNDADDGAATAEGGDGNDTFIMKPLSGLPEETVAHVLTGGAGADVYAFDIDGATAIRDGVEEDNQIIATISDFDPAEDMLMLDIGAKSSFDDVDELPLPEVSTTEDPGGEFVDVHFSWTNPLNPDNVETRTVRLEGLSEFDTSDVQLTSMFDPDSQHNETDTGDADAHRVFGLTPTEGSDTADDLTLSENSATVLKDGDDNAEITDGSHLVYSGEGNDSIEVTEANDGVIQLFGGEGDDILTADLVQNNDTALIGGDGDDTITFGMGHYVEGGEGSDTLVLNLHEDAMDQGPAVLKQLTGNHLTINIPEGLEGEVDVINHTYSNGFEVAYSEIFVGDVCILKIMEEDFATGVGIAEEDPRLEILRAA
ncbi:MAG: hypothetical protein JJ868_11375 [Shimia sp.]|uniref:hypothetical protein n=1 Tax=Shimia sp. TaxID=1954381 RepID=UPI001B0EF79D|nr:hypothetical protein [Shimia sp.]MBO6897962.1 hypothetical protein [Shimia sp.]